MRIRFLIAPLFLVSCLTPQSEGPATKIGPSAVWQLPVQFTATADPACEPSSSSEYGECTIGQMAKTGAPADAVLFTRELYKESHGQFGIMTGFRDEGPVAFAWVTYPLRANTNFGFLLVNGQPRIIDVEDLKLLDTKAMRQSGQFQDLRGQFPAQVRLPDCPLKVSDPHRS
jgi:hypothetical protein